MLEWINELLSKFEEANSQWSENVFSKFSKVSSVTWISLGVVVALGLIVLAVSTAKKKWTSKMIAFGALAIALSFALSCVRLFKMPSHGSVTPGSMLPIMLFSVSFGIGPGLLAGLAYGILQYFQDPSFINVWQFLLDYLLAFSALGLAGIAYNKKDWWLYVSIPIAAIGRAICHILAGLMWVADTPVEELAIGSWHFGSKLGFSIVYNGVYLVIDTLICLLLALLIAKPLVKIMKTK